MTTNSCSTSWMLSSLVLIRKRRKRRTRAQRCRVSALPDQANGARANALHVLAVPAERLPLLVTLAPMVLFTRWRAMALGRLKYEAGIIISRLRTRLIPEMAEGS